VDDVCQVDEMKNEIDSSSLGKNTSYEFRWNFGNIGPSAAKVLQTLLCLARPTSRVRRAGQYICSPIACLVTVWDYFIVQ
jgi:hypothetical protein